jgi:hypothetical protein
VTTQIDLTGTDLFEVRGRHIMVFGDDHDSFYRIPTGAKITRWKRGKHSTLNVGSFNSITCSVRAGHDTINQLWSELTDPKPPK